MKDKQHYHMTPMASKNEHTGEVMQSKGLTKAYDEGYERIWGKPEPPKEKDKSWIWKPE